MNFPARKPRPAPARPAPLRAAVAVRVEPLEHRVLLHDGAAAEVTTGLLGEYFGDPNQTNLLIARTDPAINFAWGKHAPAPELPADNFSVRWTGQYLAEATGHYRFRVLADDGVRVAFGGQTVVDRWVGKGRKGWNVFQVDLVQGQKYDLRVDYADRKGKAGIRLLSRGPAVKRWQAAAAPQLVAPVDTTPP